MEKEDWIHKVITSADSLEKVSPPADLFSRIESKINKKPAKLIPLHWVLGVAASFLVLVFMNISALRVNGNNFSDSSNSQLESIESELDPSNHLY